MRIRSLLLAGLLLFVAAPLNGCGDDEPEARPADAGTSNETAPQLAFVAAPVGGVPEGTRFAGAVPYGTEAGQVLDAFLPASSTPTAAVLYVHGGGFVAGTRSDAYEGAASAVHQVLGAGVAWIGVEYRLLQPAGTETEGVIKSLQDSKRALQFVRHWASVFNVDAQRIGVLGPSAGAGTGLWLAFHDDMAAADSPDPVLRESTRPQAVSAVAPQATYDLLRWAPDVLYGEYPYVNNDLFLNQQVLRTQIVQFYGLDAALAESGPALLAELQTPAMAQYRADVDMLALMSAGDVPVYLNVDVPNRAPLDPAFDLLHHPLHAKAVHEHAAEVGTASSADIPAYQVTSNAPPADEPVNFLLRQLGAR